MLQKQLAIQLEISESVLSAYMTNKTRVGGWNFLERQLRKWVNDRSKDTSIDFIDCTNEFVSNTQPQQQQQQQQQQQHKSK